MPRLERSTSNGGCFIASAISLSRITNPNKAFTRYTAAVAGGTAGSPFPEKREPFLEKFSTDQLPDAKQIRAQLEKMANSESFLRSPRILELLEYLIRYVQSGQQDRIKESLIGVEFFGRSPNYDTKKDPIVRAEMRRARGKLSEYYLHEGAASPVLI